MQVHMHLNYVLPEDPCLRSLSILYIFLIYYPVCQIFPKIVCTTDGVLDMEETVKETINHTFENLWRLPPPDKYMTRFWCLHLCVCSPTPLGCPIRSSLLKPSLLMGKNLGLRDWERGEPGLDRVTHNNNQIDIFVYKKNRVKVFQQEVDGTSLIFKIVAQSLLSITPKTLYNLSSMLSLHRERLLL